MLLGTPSPEATPAPASAATTFPYDAPSPEPLVSPALYPLDPRNTPAAPVLPAAELVLPATRTSGSIPPRVLAAYVRAADQNRACGMTWSLLAGIGSIESHHARSGGSEQAGWNGTARPAILGPRLDGNGPWGRISDSDHGTLDGDLQWDRAVGPMQFIPSTWRTWGSDGNDDGVRDPQSIDDAALAAARYLCASGDVRGPAGLYQAVFSYNHSADYVRAVLGMAQSYAVSTSAAEVLRTLPGSQGDSPATSGSVPVVDPTVPTPAWPAVPSTEPRPGNTGHPVPSPSGTSPSAAPSASPTPRPTQPAPSPTPTIVPTEVECTC